ncbi:MAG: pyruvate kinase [Candidatus Metalachnospira sp.]|nr:pyruvate kinase [Candidatus Metalachnospira sp.]
MRKTKIICTLGPATDDISVLESMIDEGMNAARFNFSHSNYEEHLKRLEMLKAARKKKGKYVAALLDTKGPEIRVCKFKEGSIMLETGAEFTLTTRDVEGDSSIVSVTYKDFPNDVSVGTRVLIDDGLIELTVLEKTDTDVKCRVVNPGPVSDNKGVNLPGTIVSMPYMSEKDVADINFAVDNEFDYIAASFARTAGDILKIRRILEERSCSTIALIAKIENRQGVENIDEILQVSDGVMIARGDMGVEIPYEDVPVIQKMIIKKALKAGKVTITATQMLESMIKNPRPTRAEAADVANAVFDGTGGIMLSGETAVGKYPVEAVKTMARVAVRAEEAINYKKRFFTEDRKSNPNVTDAISHATCTTAHDLSARAILTVTKSGATARNISKYRPNCYIIACATTENLCRRLNLAWGVMPILVDDQFDTFELFDRCIDEAVELGFLEKGDTTVITAGLPLGIPGTTNMIKVQMVGNKY